MTNGRIVSRLPITSSPRIGQPIRVFSTFSLPFGGPSVAARDTDLSRQKGCGMSATDNKKQGAKKIIAEAYAHPHACLTDP